MSENIETEFENPEDIVSIRRCTTDILSKEGVTSRLFSGVQSWMLSQRSEGFNPRKSFNPGMRFNSGITLEGFNSGISLSGLVSNENLGTYVRTYVPTRVRSENSGERMSEQISLKWNAWMGFLGVCKWFARKRKSATGLNMF